MCYFVEINLPRAELAKRFGVNVPEDPRYTPGFFHSAFTRPYLPVITNHNPDEVQFFRWGLIPSWVKDEETAEKILNGTFNAKSETIWEKPSFRHAATHQRCIVASHGFFEWHTEGKKKTPYYIKRKDDKPFAFAGLYENWTNKQTGELLQTFSIITTPANRMLEKIHNLKKRMPAILPLETEKEWISNSLSRAELSRILNPLPDELLTAWPVSGKKLYRLADISDPSVIEPCDPL